MLELGKYPEVSLERQMSHQERSSVRAAYIHKAEHLRERGLNRHGFNRHLGVI